jgi:mono/diheme cytochrome c family protein
MKRLMFLAVAGTLALGFAAPARATMEIQKQAKAAGATVTNCASCHVDKMPKKGASALNDAGKWLTDQKTAKKAEKIDGAWFKDYKKP